MQTEADRKVVAAWRVYLDSLDFGRMEDPAFAAKVEQSREKFVDLLFEMSRSLGYEFEKVLLKKGVYSPVAHGNAQVQERQIREGLARILSGEASLGVTSVFSEDAIKQQQKFQTALGKMLAGTQPIAVKISNSSTSGPT